MKRVVYAFEIDASRQPTGLLLKQFIERPKEKKGQHNWVAACDKNGDEVFGYCELCGKKQSKGGIACL